MKKIKISIWERIFLDSILCSANVNIKEIFEIHKIFNKINFSENEKKEYNIKVIPDHHGRNNISWEDKYNDLEFELELEDYTFEVLLKIFQETSFKYDPKLINLLNKIQETSK